MNFTNNCLDFDSLLLNFEETEKIHDVENWTINDVYIWKLVRFTIFSECRRPDSNVIRKKKSKNSFYDDLKTIFYDTKPYSQYECNIRRIIITSNKARVCNDSIIDPITMRAWKYDLEQSLVLCENIPYLNDIKNTANTSRINAYASLLAKFLGKRIANKDIKKMNDIANDLNIKNNERLISIIKNKLAKFLSEKYLYKKFIQKYQPSYLYLTNSYAKEAVIDCAKNAGIKVIEFQHGGLGRGHMGYDFKNWKRVPYFPDYIFAYGPAWFESCSIPDSCKLLPIGSSALRDNIALAKKNVNTRYKQILVLSQWSLVEQIKSFLLDCIKLMPEWSFVLRPHPNENIDNTHKMYSNVIQKYGNLIIDNETDLYEQALMSEVAVSISSTALIESLCCGCKVAVLDVDNGPNYYTNLVNSGDAFLIKKADDLINNIQNIPIGNATDYYSNTKENIIQILENKYH